MKLRRSGILMHVTSLPAEYGIGDFGPKAYRFADFLSETKQGYWQILPLSPTDPAYGNSPYHSISAFACNPLLISPDILVEDGLLDKSEAEVTPGFPSEKVNYDSAFGFKYKLLLRAFERFVPDAEFNKFCSFNSSWLDDYAFFAAMKEETGGKSWQEWDPKIREKDPDVLKSLQKQLQPKIEKEKFLQYICDRQWKNLKNYCNQKMIHIIGDIPIYVDYDSVDVWSYPEIFKLDRDKKPYVVAGVPPDYFSSTGQLWGNPLYQWDELRKRDFDWWIKRIERNFNLFDMVRIDHFRGLVGCWEVPAGEKTAEKGRWCEVPAGDLFRQLKKRFPSLPVIAEDLGTITPDVKEVMRHFELPGMKVLLFAFGDDDPMHPYLPHTYEENYVVYTGTHDNNTIHGWIQNEAGLEEKKRLSRYIGKEFSEKEIHWDFIRLAMMSVAFASIIPMQDILGLGAESRMNLPASDKGNWEWRLSAEQQTHILVDRLAGMTETYGRA
jgi:4-alpha-glucanotransferase